MQIRSKWYIDRPKLKRRVMRKVVAAEVSPNAANSGSNWRLTLECGHQAGAHRQSGRENRNWKTYAAPKRVLCRKCSETFVTKETRS